MASTNATRTLLDTLNRALDHWAPPLPWSLGYSGGRDSGVLLWALSEVTAPGNLTALHVDHGWRPAAEREAEAALAAAWCARRGVNLRKFPPPPPGPASEAAARAYRYACFEQFVGEHQGSPVFLAHHADDQAETVLMRLLRGRSWQGLAGMPARRGPFLRPFLGLRAALLAEVAARQAIPYAEDSTNADPGFSRNFLRRRVFPLMTEKFPRAVEALNEFAGAWRQAAPSVEADAAWAVEAGAALVPTPVWDGWSPLQRQAQLLAAAHKLTREVRLGRRFLETVAADRLSPARGAGWSWSRSAQTVRWSVAPAAFKEYFLTADAGTEYDLPSYTLSWSPDDPRSGGALFVPGVDAARPWVWRSVVPGMPLASAGNADWGRETRKRRLGTLDPSRCALVLQDGLLVAALDPLANRLLWTETGHGKLHKPGIFVKLRQRSDYERR
jgi:tRNA(Ile)-lysidine synthetase-like protein